MRNLLSLSAFIAASTLLSGCGGEDFTGAYRLKESGMKGTMVLNIHGGNAELFGDLGKDGIKPLGKMNVSVKDKKRRLQKLSATRLLD